MVSVPDQESQVWYQISKAKTSITRLRAAGLGKSSMQNRCLRTDLLHICTMVKDGNRRRLAMHPSSAIEESVKLPTLLQSHYRDPTVNAPLAAIKAVEPSRAIAGPAAGASSAALGAQVIKV